MAGFGRTKETPKGGRSLPGDIKIALFGSGMYQNGSYMHH